MIKLKIKNEISQLIIKIININTFVQFAEKLPQYLEINLTLLNLIIIYFLINSLNYYFYAIFNIWIILNKMF